MPTVVVEDGTGLTNANSYISLVDFKSYMAEIGISLTLYTDDVINAYLISVASDFMEFNYTYCGAVTFPLTPQALSFPRTELVNRHGTDIPSSGTGSIFTDLRKAQSQLVLGQLTTTGKQTVNSDASNRGAVVKNQLDVMVQEYASPGTEVQTSEFQTYLDYAFTILSPYLCGGNSPFQIANVAVV